MAVISSEAKAWLETARRLEPLVAQYREEGERERKIPPALMQALHTAGFLNLVLPKAFGGHQVELETYLRVIEEFSRQDGAAGWCMMIWSSCGAFADYLPETSSAKIFNKGASILAGALAPAGRATPVVGGYRVSGRWSFASGCQYADWLVGSCTVASEGNQAPSGPRLFVMPAADCQIFDTWDTAGMRGTGSHDFAVSDLLVPDGQSFPLADLSAGPTLRKATGYQQSFFSWGPTLVAAVALGIARDAIDSFRALSESKVPRGATSPLVNQHTVHERVGKAEALLRAGRAYVFDVAQELNSSWPDDPVAKSDLTAASRLASTFAAQCAVEATDLMFDLGGGTSIYKTSRLERCFRDVHVATHHHLVAPSNIEMVGQYLLGLGLQQRR